MNFIINIPEELQIKTIDHCNPVYGDMINMRLSNDYVEFNPMLVIHCYYDSDTFIKYKNGELTDDDLKSDNIKLWYVDCIDIHGRIYRLQYYELVLLDQKDPRVNKYKKYIIQQYLPDEKLITYEVNSKLPSKYIPIIHTVLRTDKYYKSTVRGYIDNYKQDKVTHYKDHRVKVIGLVPTQLGYDIYLVEI